MLWCLLLICALGAEANLATERIDAPKTAAVNARSSVDKVIQPWIKNGQVDIRKALRVEPNENIAKNVILFVGDGMGPATVTASRIYHKGEQDHLFFENFPNLGLLKTYSNNKLVPDSASTATALFTGIKVNQKTLGVDPSVEESDCEASLDPKTHLDNIAIWAQKAGKSTGFVTTTRVTHATPAALYAHCPNRKWECEDTVENVKCKDIAKQLIEDLPGRDFNVIMGGGRQCLVSNSESRPGDPLDTYACRSKDGRNLINQWKTLQAGQQRSAAVLMNNEDLLNFDAAKNDFVLGVFANGHLPMNHVRDKGIGGTPSLSNMTIAALKVLQKNPKGFLLVVEGGLIDFAHHRGHAKQALSETAEFSDTIERAFTHLGDEILKDTLVIVTADHDHSMLITGYPSRGSPITGIGDSSKVDKVPYTALLYGTGGENNYQFKVENDTVVRKNPQEEDTNSFDYSQQSAVLNDEVTHGGSDVTVFAQGPMAHLFHKVHEQTFVANVISYAINIGPLERDKVNDASAAAAKVNVLFILLPLALLVSMCN